MRLRSLLAYLLSPSYRLAPTNVVPIIAIFGIAAVGFAAVLRYGWSALGLAIAFSSWAFVAHRMHQAAIRRLSHATLRTDEAQEWFHLVRQFADDGTLESRADPRMGVELEACAEAYQRIVTALETAAWRERRRRSEAWRDVARESLAIAEDLMADALLISRPLFRPKGGRHATFERRCSDPSFGARELAQLALIRCRIERLAGELGDDPQALEKAGSYERALAYLDDLRRAEEEVARLGH